MVGKNALQNANTFTWICNFGVDFLICDMEPAKFQEVHTDVLRKPHHSLLNSIYSLRGATINGNPGSPKEILQAGQ